jgi:hypothetical protein
MGSSKKWRKLHARLRAQCASPLQPWPTPFHRQQRKRERCRRQHRPQDATAAQTGARGAASTRIRSHAQLAPPSKPAWLQQRLLKSLPLHLALQLHHLLFPVEHLGLLQTGTVGVLSQRPLQSTLLSSQTLVG